MAAMPQTVFSASTWTANADGTWSNAGNWDTLPASGTTTSLIFGGTADYTATNDIGAATFTLNSISVTNTSSTTLASLAAANSITLGGTTPSITVETAAGGTTISPTLIFANSSTATITNKSNNLLTLGTGVTGTSINYGTSTNISINNGVFGAGNSGSVQIKDVGTFSGTTTLTLSNFSTGTFSIGNMAGVAGTLKIAAGAVTVVGNTGGDLFGGSLILDVAQGASFDFGGNAEGMGGVQGAGTIVLSAGVTGSAAGNRTFTGKMTGSAGFTHDGTGIFTWGNAVPGLTSDYNGNTGITGGGSIVCTAANVLSPNSLMLVQPVNGALDIGGFNQTIAGLAGGTTATNMPIGAATLIVNPSGTRVFFGNISGTGNLTIGGTGTEIMLGAHGYTGATTLTGSSTLRATSAGLSATSSISLGTGTTLDLNSTADETWSRAISGTGSFVKSGPSTVTIGAGGLMPNIAGLGVSFGGTLKLDYSGDNSSKIGGSTSLLLGSGTVSVVGNGAAGTSESFAGTKLQGGGKLNVTTGTDQNASIALGAMTRSAGATLNLNLVNTGAGVASVTTTTNNTAIGAANIIGAHATVNGTDWAVSGTGAGPFAITPLAPSSYVANDFGAANAGSPNVHSDVSGTQAPAANFTDVATVRFNSSGASTLTLPAGLNSLKNGGILVTPNVGANTVTISGGASVTGKLDIPAGSELVLQQQNTAGQLTISSIINGTGTSVITKAGPGTVAITNIATATPNTFAGTYNLVDGVLAISGTIAQGPTQTPTNGGPTTNFMGGTLRLTGAYAGGTSQTIPWVITPLGGTLDVLTGVSASKNGNAISGSGNFTKIGVGLFSIGTNASPYSGILTISQGTIRNTANVMTSVQAINVESGAQYQIQDNDAAGAFNFGTAGLLTLNGTGPSNAGAFALTDQGGGTANLGPITTFNTSVYLATNSSFSVANGSAIRPSLITFANPIGGPGGLTKIGNGTMVLSAVDTYAGPTVVANGILRISGANRIPAASSLTLGDATANTSGTFDLNAAAQTFSSIGTAGTGTANAVGNFAISTTIPALTINYAGASPLANNALIGAGVLGGNHFTFTKTGSGTLTLNGATPLGGLTTVAAGTLALGSANALSGVGAVRTNFSASVAGVSVTAGATVDTNGQTAFVRPLTLNGNGVGGAGALVNNGSSATVFNPDVYATTVSAIGSGYSAATTVSISGGGGSGATAVPSLGLSAASFTMVNAGAGYGTTQPVIVISGGGGFGATATAVLSGGTITGFTVTNPGFGYTSAPTITISAPASGTTATATADATHFVVNGIAVTNPGSGYTSAPTVTVSGTGTGATAAGVLGGAITLASTSSIGGSSDIVVNTIVSGAGGLNKIGSNTLTLSGANTFAGGTTITSGTLLVNNTTGSGTGAGAVTVGFGSTLGGSGSIAGPLTVNGTLSPGNSPGKLSLASTAALLATSNFITEVGKLVADANPPVAGSDFDQVSLGGTGATMTITDGAKLSVVELANLSAGQVFTIVDNTAGGTITGQFSDAGGAPLNEGSTVTDNLGSTFTISYANGDVTLTTQTVAPEPATMAGLALAGFGLLARRRRKST